MSLDCSVEFPSRTTAEGLESLTMFFLFSSQPEPLPSTADEGPMETVYDLRKSFVCEKPIHRDCSRTNDKNEHLVLFVFAFSVK